MGDPRPRVSKIVVAGGKKPEAVQVLRARSADDTRGQPISLEDTIDRTAEPTTPIYLTCIAKPPRSPLANNLPTPSTSGHKKTPPQYVDLPGDEGEPRLPDPLPSLGKAGVENGN